MQHDYQSNYAQLQNWIQRTSFVLVLASFNTCPIVAVVRSRIAASMAHPLRFVHAHNLHRWRSSADAQKSKNRAIVGKLANPRLAASKLN